MNVDADGPESGPSNEGRRTVWIVVGAVVVLALVALVLVLVLSGGDDDDSAPPDSTTTTVTATSSTTAAPATTAAPTTTASSATTTAPAPTTSTPPTTVAGRTSPVDLYATCGADCPGVQYSADGLPVAYHPASGTVTVLEATARDLTLDIPETQGRILAVGPDDVAYLLVESPDGANPGRIIAVPTAPSSTVTVHEIVGPTDGLGSVFVVPTAAGIEVADCCGVGVPDGQHPYVDASGAALPGDPSRATWSWEWPLSGPVVVRNNPTGQTYEVPEQIAEREGPRSGDLRPLLDGRVVMLIDDEQGEVTAWVLEPTTGSWTSTELGDALVEAVDPEGAVLVRDPSTLAYSLIPLN
jgi:hypothetical protein